MCTTNPYSVSLILSRYNVWNRDDVDKKQKIFKNIWNIKFYDGWNKNHLNKLNDVEKMLLCYNDMSRYDGCYKIHFHRRCRKEN